MCNCSLCIEKLPILHTSPHSPTVSSTLKSLSTVYREQGREETAKELEQLTKEKVGVAGPQITWLETPTDVLLSYRCWTRRSRTEWLS